MNHKHYRYISKINGIHAELADIRNKEKSLSFYTQYMLARTQSMFRYDNLPKTIPHRILELYLQLYGYVCIAEHNGELYPFFGHLGGEPDPYYMPTICVVANPALKFSKDFRIDEDCVIIPSDSTYSGLLPIFERYGTMLVETDITMLVADINMRVAALLSADDDTTRNSAMQYLDNIEAGKLGVIGSTAILEGIKAQPYGDLTSRNITQLVELHQFFRASMYNEIGLNSNYNMKRETIVSSEIEMNADALFPLIDDMLRCRKIGINKVNEMFGTDIKVELNSSWERLKEDSDLTKIEHELEILSMIPSERSDNEVNENDINGNVDNNDDIDDTNIISASGDVGEYNNNNDSSERPDREIKNDNGDEISGDDNRGEVVTETDSKVEEITEHIIEKIENIVTNHDEGEESERSDTLDDSERSDTSEENEDEEDASETKTE